MPAQYKEITQREMEDFLQVGGDGKPRDKFVTASGSFRFFRLELLGTIELVYGARLNEFLTLRIYTTIIPGSQSRPYGTDAIRTVLFWRDKPDAKVMLIGVQKKVLRTTGWRSSLKDRIDGWKDMLGPNCNCGAPTVERKGKLQRQKFFGCALWPNCPCHKKAGG